MTLTTDLLRVQNVSVSYGSVEALHNINLALPKGQIISVIGANGAGKSTLLNTLMGLLPYQGQITSGLVPPKRKWRVEMLVAHGIALVPETRELFGQMTVEDNLTLGAYSRYIQGHRDQDTSLAEVYEWFPRLYERKEQYANTLSGGERQMLAIGRALMAKPSVLMLDEPSLGLAPLIVVEILEIVQKLRDVGVSILLVEQNARAALRISDYGYVLEMGQVVLEGKAQELLHNPQIVSSYLGVKG